MEMAALIFSRMAFRILDGGDISRVIRISEGSRLCIPHLEVGHPDFIQDRHVGVIGRLPGRLDRNQCLTGRLGIARVDSVVEDMLPYLLADQLDRRRQIFHEDEALLVDQDLEHVALLDRWRLDIILQFRRKHHPDSRIHVNGRGHKKEDEQQEGDVGHR
jgi:hypothetical protein